MSSKERPKEVVLRDLGKAIKPVGMTPLKAAVMSEDRGLKTVPITPVRPAQPTQPASPPVQPAQSPKK